MYIKNNAAALVFRVLFLAACGGGLAVKLTGPGESLGTVMEDFTVIACLLGFIYFVYLVVGRPSNERGSLRGAVTIYMAVILIRWLLASWGSSAAAAETGAGYLLLCLAAPAIAFADYILFCPKGRFSVYSPAFWTIIPVLFNLAVLIVNRMGAALRPVEYFTMPGAGFPESLFLFLGTGYLLLLLDSLMGRR